MFMQHIKSTPREALNWRLAFAMSVFGFLGMSRGSDEGIISGIQESPAWRRTYSIAAGSSTESNVVSMVQIGCVPGSLLAFLIVDSLGRVRTAQICCTLWLLGNTLWISSAGNVGLMYAARFVSGVGIGGFPVVCPTFLAEIAPRTVRGLAVCLFSMSVYIGVTLGYFSNLGTSIHFSDLDNAQWRIPIATNFVYSGLALIGTFFIKESPRWLAKKGGDTEAAAVLSWYRNMDVSHPFVRDELEGIHDQNRVEREARAGKSAFYLVRDLFGQADNLYRLLAVGIGVQIIGQWSGGGSLTIYAPKIFKLVGVKENTKLYTTATFGIVKLIASAVCAFFLIDMLGRKRSVFIGISLQTLAALYLTLYLSQTNPGHETKLKSAIEERASFAAIVMVFIAGCGWALGLNSIQYLIGTEIWPVSLRAIATSIIMAFHFANQYGSSRATQPMIEAFDRWGLFAFWTVTSSLSILYILFFIPETSGRSLEDMDALFQRPWYRIGIMSSRVISGHESESRKIDDEDPKPVHELRRDGATTNALDDKEESVEAKREAGCRLRTTMSDV